MKTASYMIDVSIFLRGDELDPKSISNKLGVTPSSSQYANEKRISSSNQEYVTKIGVWELAAESRSFILSDHINELTAKLKSANYLRHIEGVQEAYVDVFIASDADEDGEGTFEFELSEENIAALAQIGLPIRFTAALVKK